MPDPVVLQIRADTKTASADVKALNRDIQAAFQQVKDIVASVNAEIKSLVFNPEGILRGAEQATRGMESVADASRLAERELRGVERTSGEAGGAVKNLGTQAAGAERKIGALTATAAGSGTAFGDMGTAADAANVAIDGLDEAAATAGKSVSGLGRAAAAALPRLDALSGAAFDPAGVVAGADEAAGALVRVKTAAAEARASIRASGGSLPPIFFPGARRGLAGGEERPATFGGGVRAGIGAAGDLAGGGAALITILSALTGKMSIDFENAIQKVKGNTTMSDADVGALRAQTLRLMRTGTDQQELLDSYKHITNLGFHAADARQILDTSNKFGIATSTPVNETGDVIARFLNDYHMKADMAPRVANTIHFAGAGSNMDIKDLERNSSRTVGLAANYMGAEGLPDVLAAFGALVKNMRPARADTQISGMLGQIAAPSPKAEKEAAKLGITDFNAQGLRDRQLFGVISEVRDKIKDLPIKDQAAALKNLFNNKQGGIGASFLTGSRNADYNQLYNDPKTGTKAAFAGKTNAIDPLYNQQMQQTAQQFKALSGEIKSDFIPLGAKLAPVFTAAIPLIRALANGLSSLLSSFAKLPKPVQEAVLAFGAFKIITAFLPMLGGFALVSERTTAVIGGLVKMLFGLGGAAAEGEAGMAGTAAVLSGPFALGVLAVVAAVAALALAWKTDFGGIRETTAKVAGEVRGFITSQFGYVVKWFQANLPLIRETVKTVLGAMQQFWHDHGQRIMAIIGPLWSFIKTLFSSALHIILALVSFAMHVITGHWGAAAKDIGVIVTNLWAVVRSLFENGAKAIGNTLALIASLIFDAGKHWFEVAVHAAQQVISGLVSGIKNGIGQVATAAKGLAAAVPSAVTSFLDIHSPSRVMQKLGLNTAEGLAQGIRDGRVSVEQASRMLADTPRGIVQSAIRDAKRGQASAKKRGGEVHAAGEYAATVGESPEAKELHKLGELRAKGLISAQAYSNAYRQIKSKSNQASEKESARHVEALRQIEDGLKAFQKSPETPSLDKQEAVAHAEYRRQVKNLTEGSAGPYTAIQQRGIKDAGTLLGDKLDAIQQQRDAAKQREQDKQKREAQAAQEEADAATKQAQQTTVQLNREMWQHAGGDMQAYFASLVTEADDALKAVQDKYGPASTHPNAPVVQAATDQHTAQIAVIAQQQTDAQNRLADARQQHDLDQGKITLAQYVDYLTKRRDAYQQYSQEWLDIDGRLYQADEEMQRKQLQSIEDLFQAHKISLDAYKKMLADLAAQVPAASSVHEDVVHAADGAENKASRGEMVGGQEFWDSLAGSASESGSKVLTALLHPKNKKDIFKSLWTDLMGSLEGSVTGQFSKMLKNLITGQGGGGFNLRSLFGGGSGSSTASTTSGSPATAAAGAGLGSMMSLIPGIGGIGSMLPGLLGMGSAGSLTPQGINGPVGGLTGLTGMLTGRPSQGGPLGGLTSLLPMLGHGGLLGGLLGHGGLASMAHLLPWLGGGILLNKILGNPIGKLFKHLHLFSKGGIVPGTGNHDSVHAMLTPGEIVIPKSLAAHFQQAAMPQARTAPFSGTYGTSAPGVSPQGTTTGQATAAGSVSAVFHDYGDKIYHYEADEEKSRRKTARQMEDALRSGVPA